MSYNSKQLKVQSSAKKLPKPKDVDYISKMGYRDGSPFGDNPYNDIYTPNGIIDMSQTGIPLFANGQYLPPYSGMHDMGTENVREIPVAKKGGQKGLRQFTSKNIQTSLNDIMQRNTTFFGSSGKKRYKPDLNYKYGGWLDQYQGGDQVNTSNWKKSSKDSFNLYNRGEEMVKWAKENPNFTTTEHNKKADELDIKYPVSSMPWSGKNSFIGATNWATLNSTKSGYWGVPLYDKPVGVQKEIKQQLVVSPPVVSPFVIPAPVAVPKVQTEYVIRENNFGPPIKYRINPNTKQYYPITDIPKNTPQSDITTIPFVNEMKKYGGWLEQYQTKGPVSTNAYPLPKANPLLIQAFQQSLVNQKINEQKAIDAKNQEIKNNPLGIKTLTTARDNTNVVPVRQLTTLSNIEADKKRNEADRLLKQQKKTQGTLRETPKEINPNEAWRLAASNYQGHDKEEMNRIINSSKTVEGLGALAGVTGGGLHALVSIPAVANTIGLGFAVNGVHSLPSTYRTLVDPNESVYNKARALTYNAADFVGMKQAAEALKGVGTAGKWAYNSAARSVATSKQSGLLSNAHNLNPKAFKPNPEDYYRGIGEKGLKNDQETNSIISRDPKYYTSPYFSQQGDFRMAQAFNDDVIVEAKGKSLYDDLANLNKNDLVFTRSNMGNVPLKHNSLSNVTPGVNLEGNLVDVGLESIPLNNPNIRILKKDWWQGYKPIEVPKQLPGSPNVTSSVNDVFPITLTTPNSGYKFPKVSPDAKSIAIHEGNKFVDANWKARNNIETFFKNNNIDVATLPQSKMVSSKVGYDYVLPEGVTHDMLNEYARLHHSKFPISEEFKQVGETIRKLNPDAKINPISSHSIHGVASNIHPDFNGKLGQGLEVPKQLPGSPNVDPPIQQMGFFNTKGAFQKYPKGKLTQEEINAFKNSDHYKQSTKEHLELKNKFGNSWTLPNYAEEALHEAITTGNRSRINPILYGGRNWGVNDYIIAGLAGTAYPGVAGLYGLAFSPPAVKNKVLNTAGITSTPGTLSSKDTTINITNRPMDFAKVNETADGQVIIGGEFI